MSAARLLGMPHDVRGYRLTWKRFANFHLGRYEALRARPVVRSRPSRLVIEPTNVSLTSLTNRPNQTCDPNEGGARTIALWFNTACFQRLTLAANAADLAEKEGVDSQRLERAKRIASGVIPKGSHGSSGRRRPKLSSVSREIPSAAQYDARCVSTSSTPKTS